MDLYAENENYRRIVDEMAATYVCRHCDARARLMVAAGGRRALECNARARLSRSRGLRRRLHCMTAIRH
jgi:hypothetical protein